jgi:putative transposase
MVFLWRLRVCRRCHAWLASGTVYGHRKITRELRETGERCSRHRVRRLMKAEGIRAGIGYGTKRRHRGGPLGVVENVVNRDFSPTAPNKVWVTDITYIRTYEGWIFLAVIVDLYSRQVVSWATQSQMTTDLVLEALVSAIWKRKPAAGLIIHSDQASQFTSSDWLSLLKQHGIVPSMSRRGNCHDNAVAKSFFSALKKERIKRRIYPTWDEAHFDVFNYIEMFYNPVRRHGSAGDLARSLMKSAYTIQISYSNRHWEPIGFGDFGTVDEAEAYIEYLEQNAGWRNMRVVDDTEKVLLYGEEADQEQ